MVGWKIPPGSRQLSAISRQPGLFLTAGRYPREPGTLPPGKMPRTAPQVGPAHAMERAAKRKTQDRHTAAELPEPVCVAHHFPGPRTHSARLNSE
jgi:hypothetical protein